MTSSRVRRGMLAIVMGAVALALSACAGLPASGPVFAGLPPGAAAPPDFSFVAQKPQDGASPEQIVQGFIGAGIGPESNWAVAKLYLAPSFRDQWKPGENTTIDDRSARAYTQTGDDAVQLSITQRAIVDSTGAYKTSEGGRTPLSFSLAKVDGQWRITEAPDGIVIGADQFTSVYRQYPLMFFDPDWRYLVADVRWFPSSNAATLIATTLINSGPSPWLAGSVVTAFPDSVKARPSVPAPGGIAQVELSGAVLSLEPQMLGRMQTQLQRSLAGAGIADVSMTDSNGAPVDAQGVATASTRIDSRAIVRTRKGFGFLAADDAVEPIARISEAMSRLDPTAIELASDYSAAAVRTAGGAVARVPAEGDIVSLDHRAGLIDPVIDAKGDIWSAPAAEPDGLAAFTPDGKRLGVGGSWSNASHVTAMALSRDGTRLAAILTVGGQPQVEVFGIVRSEGGLQLGEPLVVAKLPGEGIDLTWLGDTTLGILARSGTDTVEIEQIVGGPGTSMSAPAGVTTIAGTTNTTVRLRGDDGTLYSQRGSNWEQAGSGILVLADAQGMPAQG